MKIVRIFRYLLLLGFLCVLSLLAYDYVFGEKVDYFLDSYEEILSDQELITLYYNFYGFYPENSSQKEESDDNFWANFNHNENDEKNGAYNGNVTEDSDKSSNSGANNAIGDLLKEFSNFELNEKFYYSNSEAFEEFALDKSRVKFIECAKSYLGTPYEYGGTSRSGVDCSGFIFLAALEAGLGTVPRNANMLYNFATDISDAAREPGDLVFFNSDGRITHVGIFIGDGQFIHAASDGSSTGVIISKLSESYWKKHYNSTGRIIVNSKTLKNSDSI